MISDVKITKLKKTSLSFAISIFRTALFVLLAFVIFYPIVTKLSFAFMTAEDVHDLSVNYVPKHFTFENFKLAWSQMNLLKVYPVTIAYCAGVSLLQMMICAMVGYGIARFKFALAKPVMILVVLSLLIPPDLLLIALYNIFVNFDFWGLISALNEGNTLSLIDSFWPSLLLALTGTGYRCGLYILLLRQFFRGMPKELEEAAYIDGASYLRCYVSVILPSSITMLITVFLFSFVWTWLDRTYTPLLMPETDIIVNAATSILDLNYQVGANDSVTKSLFVNAGIIYVILPLVVLYLFTQRHFIQSIERSGLVG